MAKTATAKKVKLKPFQKLLTVMISGKPVTKEEIDTLLGHEIYMYRISTYMWHIKTNANGIIKVVKDGRKVAGYQLINVGEVKDYMKRVGVLDAYTPAVKPVSKLNELEATELPKSEEMVVTKIEASV
jgi:hypothetical protein